MFGITFQALGTVVIAMIAYTFVCSLSDIVLEDVMILQNTQLQQMSFNFMHIVHLCTIYQEEPSAYCIPVNSNILYSKVQ